MKLDGAACTFLWGSGLCRPLSVSPLPRGLFFNGYWRKSGGTLGRSEPIFNSSSASAYEAMGGNACVDFFGGGFCRFFSSRGNEPISSPAIGTPGFSDVKVRAGVPPASDALAFRDAGPICSPGALQVI